MHDEPGMPHTHEDEAGLPDSLGDAPLSEHVELTTVGIDIGSSTSHLMFSRLYLERLGQYHSSRYVVVKRETLHRSPILLTPYTSDYNINAAQLETFVQQSYAEAGLRPEDIDSGAIILTGVAVERTNAHAIADLFAAHAGKFVCATAGPNLEAILAAHGSGAAALSREPAATVLNVDVGGGTTKFALIRNGEIVETAAINVGGRLVATDADGLIARIEPAAMTVAERLGIELRLGDVLGADETRRFAETLADRLVEIIRREALTPLTEELLITPPLSYAGPIDVLTFSGGVSEFIYAREQRDFGDLARPLADAIRARLEGGAMPAPLRASDERIRATVIGASQFTVQVSGNTISISRPELLPIRNLQVVYPLLAEGQDPTPEEMADAIRRGFQRLDLTEGEQAVAVAINWDGLPRYQLLRHLAEGIVNGLPNSVAAGLPIVLVFDNDFGRLVGRIMQEEFGISNDVISIDTIRLQEFDYLDIGEVIEPAGVVPVVVKSLVFPEVRGRKAEVVET